MGNTLRKVENINDYNDYNEYKYSNENDILRETQKLLRNDCEDALLLKITQLSAKCDYEGKFSTPPICKLIRNYKSEIWIPFSNDLSEGEMDKYKFEKLFIERIKNSSDFITAYFLTEEINTIWLVIKEFTFEANENYFKIARSFKNNNNCDFNLVLFEKDELEEVKEEIKYFDEYEEFQ